MFLVVFIARENRRKIAFRKFNEIEKKALLIIFFKIMSLKIYNTLSRKKEFFKPLSSKKVRLFVCGPTVYNFSHIGHARTCIVFDSFVKYLRQNNYQVFYLQNITNVDDKILNQAKKEKISWEKLALKFEKEYLKDMENLKVDSVTKYARATDYIKEIISQIERLMAKGYAYETRDGIYYDISKFKNYGKLSKRTVLQAEDAVSRIDESKGKKNKGDFCLWKKSKQGEPKWKSPWFLGRPGWHIEDTAIVEKHFGPQYDIHGGARDLIFPHHEAEIAQMEAVSGKKPMVKYWLHTGFLTVNGDKMAKSKSNFIFIKDSLKKHSYRSLRFFILKSHYRLPVDYREEAIFQAENGIKRIDEFLEKIKNLSLIKDKKKSLKITKDFEKEFKTALNDDFNTPRAISVIFKLIKKGNSLIDKNKLTGAEAKEILNFFKKVDEVFNFFFEEKQEIPQEILALAKQREEARRKLQWEKSDKIREKINKLGYNIEDTKDGFHLRRV